VQTVTNAYTSTTTFFWPGPGWTEIVTAVATAVIALGVVVAVTIWLIERRKRSGPVSQEVGGGSPKIRG